MFIKIDVESRWLMMRERHNFIMISVQENSAIKIMYASLSYYKNCDKASLIGNLHFHNFSNITLHFSFSVNITKQLSVVRPSWIVSVPMATISLYMLIIFLDGSSFITHQVLLLRKYILLR